MGNQNPATLPPFHFAPDEMPYVRDLAADELRAFYRLSDDDVPANATSTIQSIFDRADAFMNTKPAPAETPFFPLNELFYIIDLFADEVGALDEMDPDENRDGALETLARAQARLTAYLTARAGN